MVKPYRPSECATYMGMSENWVRHAITRGVQTLDHQTVYLPAEKLTVLSKTGKPKILYRIHTEDFDRFLRAIGWQHLPRQPRPLTDAHASASP